MHMRTIFAVLFAVLMTSGCGYHFRTSKVVEQSGIKKVYVPLFKNDSMEKGVEWIMTNAFIQELASTGIWEITRKSSGSDATILGTIRSADSQISSLTSASGLPTGSTESSSDVAISGGGETLVVSQYRTGVVCDIVFKDKTGKILFQKEFTRSENFAASHRLGIASVVNPTMNLSRKDYSYQAMSETLMIEAVSVILQSF